MCEQKHRERLLHAIMRGDYQSVRDTLLEVKSAHTLGNLKFIVRRLEDENLLSLMHARIEELCAFNARVE